MAHPVANADMADAWDGDEGDDWARHWEHYDRSVQNYHRVLFGAANIGASDQVLDVGCGNGESTREAARAAPDGSALGVDLSSRMVERAKELAQANGLTNVRFERADAQVYPFDPGSYDVVVSRFGAMFFADPVAAFANIRAATRPGGRLLLVAWRSAGDNEWLRCVFAALAVGRDLPVPPTGGPGPFGLADPDQVHARLTEAGYESVELTAVDKPLWLGADGDDAFGFFSGNGVVRGLTQGLDEKQRASAMSALRVTMDKHDTGDGVLFDSGVWLISARRPAR